jgi:hypothetical protein
MKQKTKQNEMLIKIQKRPYQLSGKLVKEFTLVHVDYMEFEVTEASENSPYQIGQTILLSKNEIKYHLVKYQ